MQSWRRLEKTRNDRDEEREVLEAVRLNIQRLMADAEKLTNERDKAQEALREARADVKWLTVELATTMTEQDKLGIELQTVTGDRDEFDGEFE